MGNRTAGLILGVGIIAFSASPAIAFKSVTSPDGGARASTSVSGGTVYAADIKCDGKRTKATYSASGQPIRDLVNSSNCNTTVQISPGYITTAIRACTLYSLQPDSCSAFV